MDAKTIILYADGACSGNPGPGGWGSVILFPEGRVRELGGGEAHTTNNRMELSAAIEALRAVGKRAEPAILLTDSRYVISGITLWIASWRRKNWLTASGKAVLNRDLWEVLETAAAPLQGRLSWRHVRGHAGLAGNERADSIASAFAQGENFELYAGALIGYPYDLNPDSTPKNPPSLRSRRKKSKGSGYYLSLLEGTLRRHFQWEECRARVSGKSGARFRKITSSEEEEAVLRRWGLSGS